VNSEDGRDGQREMSWALQRRSSIIETVFPPAFAVGIAAVGDVERSITYRERTHQVGESPAPIAR
jgi:hypothetical protein